LYIAVVVSRFVPEYEAPNHLTGLGVVWAAEGGLPEASDRCRRLSPGRPNRAIKWKPRISRLHDLSGRSCAEPRAPRYIRTLCEDAALYAPSRAWATVEGGPRHSPHAAALGLPRVTVLGVEASVDIVFGAQGVSP
jgi:hypothetical protein